MDQNKRLHKEAMRTCKFWRHTDNRNNRRGCKRGPDKQDWHRRGLFVRRPIAFFLHARVNLPFVGASWPNGFLFVLQQDRCTHRRDLPANETYCRKKGE